VSGAEEVRKNIGAQGTKVISTWRVVLLILRIIRHCLDVHELVVEQELEPGIFDRHNLAPIQKAPQCPRSVSK